MQVDVNVVINKLTQKIANLELDNALKDAQIEVLKRQLTESQNKGVKKVEG